MTNGADASSSPARKDRRVRLGGPTNPFQLREFHLLGHADLAIVRLNNAKIPRSQNQYYAEKPKTLKTSTGTGIYEGQRKADKPTFILLTREIHSGLK